jgi:uncharacterized protein with HEPN domain
MPQHKDKISLLHMMDHSKEALSMISGKSRSSLRENRMLELALVRLVEIIGEAAGRIGLETKAKYPAIPWPQIIGMRNRLIHGYDTVDLDLLWNTIEDDLPPLIVELEKILNSF